MLVEKLIYLVYEPLVSEMDFYMKPKTNPQTDKDYYAYVLVYVDDLLHLNHDQEIFMKELEVVYRLKYGILVPPIRYLGPNVEKVQLEEVSIAWSTTIE